MAQWSRLRSRRKAEPAWAGVSAVTTRTVSQDSLVPYDCAQAMGASSPAARQASAASRPRTG